jgi:flagellar FliJ protein
MAKKFKFRLEAVLKERQRQEEKRLQEWTLARTLLQEMKNAKVKLEEKLKLAIEEGNEFSKTSNKLASQYDVYEKYLNGLKLKIQWKTQEIQRAEKLTEKKRLEYVAASQKRKALEKIRDKKLNEYLEKIRKNELKNLDDIYVMRSRLETLADLEINEEREEKAV